MEREEDSLPPGGEKSPSSYLGFFDTTQWGVGVPITVTQAGSLSSLLDLCCGGSGWVPFFLWCLAAGEWSLCKHLVSLGCPLSWSLGYREQSSVVAFCLLLPNVWVSDFFSSTPGLDEAKTQPRELPTVPFLGVPGPLPIFLLLSLQESCVCLLYNILVFNCTVWERWGKAHLYRLG